MSLTRSQKQLKMTSMEFNFRCNILTDASLVDNFRKCYDDNICSSARSHIQEQINMFLDQRQPGTVFNSTILESLIEIARTHGLDWLKRNITDNIALGNQVDEVAFGVWNICIRLLGQFIIRPSTAEGGSGGGSLLFNKLLAVVNDAPRCSIFSVRRMFYRSWIVLIDVIALKPRMITSMKYVNLLMLPINKNCKGRKNVSSFSHPRFMCWWHLIASMEGAISSKLIDVVIIPFISSYFDLDILKLRPTYASLMLEAFLKLMMNSPTQKGVLLEQLMPLRHYEGISMFSFREFAANFTVLLHAFETLLSYGFASNSMDSVRISNLITSFVSHLSDPNLLDEIREQFFVWVESKLFAMAQANSSIISYLIKILSALSEMPNLLLSCKCGDLTEFNLIKRCLSMMLSADAFRLFSSCQTLQPDFLQVLDHFIQKDFVLGYVIEKIEYVVDFVRTERLCGIWNVCASYTKNNPNLVIINDIEALLNFAICYLLTANNEIWKVWLEVYEVVRPLVKNLEVKLIRTSIEKVLMKRLGLGLVELENLVLIASTLLVHLDSSSLEAVIQLFGLSVDGILRLHPLTVNIPYTSLYLLAVSLLNSNEQISSSDLKRENLVKMIPSISLLIPVQKDSCMVQNIFDCIKRNFVPSNLPHNFILLMKSCLKASEESSIWFCAASFCDQFFGRILPSEVANILKQRPDSRVINRVLDVASNIPTLSKKHNHLNTTFASLFPPMKKPLVIPSSSPKSNLYKSLEEEDSSDFVPIQHKPSRIPTNLLTDHQKEVMEMRHHGYIPTLYSEVTQSQDDFLDQKNVMSESLVEDIPSTASSEPSSVSSFSVSRRSLKYKASPPVKRTKTTPKRKLSPASRKFSKKAVSPIRKKGAVHKSSKFKKSETLPSISMNKLHLSDENKVDDDPLYLCVECSDVEGVRKLLDSGNYTDTHNKTNGMTAFQLALQKTEISLNILQLFLAHKDGFGEKAEIYGPNNKKSPTKPPVILLEREMETDSSAFPFKKPQAVLSDIHSLLDNDDPLHESCGLFDDSLHHIMENDNVPLFPALLDCSTSISDSLALDLSNDIWRKIMLQDFAAKNINTVGDLARLNRREALQLKGVRPQIIATLINALSDFEAKLNLRPKPFDTTTLSKNVVPLSVAEENDEEFESNSPMILTDFPYLHWPKLIVKLHKCDANFVITNQTSVSYSNLRQLVKQADNQMEEKNSVPKKSIESLIMTPLSRSAKILELSKNKVEGSPTTPHLMLPPTPLSTPTRKSWQRCVPSPSSASPSGSILKRSLDKSSSPCSTREPGSKIRFVQFSDPPVTDEVAIPRCVSYKQVNRKPMCDLEKENNDISNLRLNLSAPIFKLDLPNGEEDCLYPSLVDCCLDDIDNIMQDLTIDLWRKVLEKDLLMHKIKSIGDLARLTVAQSKVLKGIKPPALATLRHALFLYEESIQRRRHSAVPLSAGGFESLKMERTTPEEDETEMGKVFSRPSPSPTEDETILLNRLPSTQNI